MTDRPRILFVDDDPSLLAGLRNVLHRDRKRWEMTFVLGGEAALAELGAHRYDCVVTDMRMPVVDGVAVLEVAARTAPGILRVMLTGSDTSALTANCHELLVKPCSVATLRTTLERLLAGEPH